jgi:putative intracellular protease/amidase
MRPQKALFVLTSHSVKGSTGKPTGWYLSEAAHPWKPLRDAGVAVDFVSPRGGEAPVDGFDLRDPINREFWEDPGVQAKLKRTLRPEEARPADYDAIHFVGGHGTMWDFPGDEGLARLAAGIYARGGIVAAVCHGPAGLVNVKLADGAYLVDGKRIACFTNEEEAMVGLTEVVPFLLADKLRDRGATPVPAAPWSDNVIVDGRLLTGQNPQSAGSLGEKLAEALGALALRVRDT